jgi:hypothetical protein
MMAIISSLKRRAENVGQVWGCKVSDNLANFYTARGYRLLSYLCLYQRPVGNGRGIGISLILTSRDTFAEFDLTGYQRNLTVSQALHSKVKLSSFKIH